MAEDDKWVKVDIEKTGLFGITKTKNSIFVPMAQKAEDKPVKPNTRSQYISTSRKLLVTTRENSANVDVIQIKGLIKPKFIYKHERYIDERKPDADIIEGRSITINASLTTEKEVLDLMRSKNILVRHVDKFDSI
jgi:hypothetical protein